MITKKDVMHISRLARIELVDAETVKFEKELSAVLDFIEKLQEVDTTNVDATPREGRLINVSRIDEISDTAFDRKEKLTGAAKLVTATPLHEGGFVKVKAVFE